MDKESISFLVICFSIIILFIAVILPKNILKKSKYNNKSNNRKNPAYFDIPNCDKHLNLYKNKLKEYEMNLSIKKNNDYCIHIWFILQEILKYYSNDALSNYIQYFCENLFHYIILDYTINIKIKYDFLVNIASLNQLFKKLLHKVKELYKNINLLSNIKYVQDVEDNRKVRKYLLNCREILIDISVLYKIYSDYLIKKKITNHKNKIFNKSLMYINHIYDIDEELDKEYIEEKYKKNIFPFHNLYDDSVNINSRHLDIILSYSRSDHCKKSKTNAFLLIENVLYK